MIFEFYVQKYVEKLATFKIKFGAVYQPGNPQQNSGTKGLVIKKNSMHFFEAQCKASF